MPSFQYRNSHCEDYKNPLHLDVVDRYLWLMGDKTIPDKTLPILDSIYPPWVAGIDLPQSRCWYLWVDHDTWLITYHSRSSKLLPPQYLLNTGVFYDSDFGLDKGLQTLWTVSTSVYKIDILPLCVVILYTCVNYWSNKCFWILNPDLVWSVVSWGTICCYKAESDHLVIPPGSVLCHLQEMLTRAIWGLSRMGGMVS